jgi:hypothetical protein
LSYLPCFISFLDTILRCYSRTCSMTMFLELLEEHMCSLIMFFLVPEVYTCFLIMFLLLG